MTDAELNRILKSTRVPERPEEYWVRFPQRVEARLQWKPAPESAVASPWIPRLIWALTAAATACLVIGLIVEHRHDRPEAAANGLLQNEKLLRETLGMFPNRVRAIVQDEHGLALVLSDKPDVPLSNPLWVRICDGRHCEAVVTFSGQEIQVEGQKVTVLSDANGGVMVLGDRFVWTSGSSLAKTDGYRIEARELTRLPTS